MPGAGRGGATRGGMLVDLMKNRDLIIKKRVSSFTFICLNSYHSCHGNGDCFMKRKD